MVGEDAVSVYTQLLMKFIDLLSKIGEEHRQNKNRKPVKIRHGSLSRSDFTKLMENGAEFKFVSVPTEDANAVEQCAKDLGGSFFRVDPKDTETDTTMFAVPKSQIDLMNIAIKRTISESLTNTPDKLMVMEGKDSIAGEDMPLVSDIMNRFDIPVMPFKNKNGEYTVIVPTEYDGQYQQAMDKVSEIKSKMKNVDVLSFHQNGDLKEPEYLARELSADEVSELSRKIKSQGLDIKISKYEDKLYAVYDRNISDNINNIIAGYNDDLHESDEYLLTLNDNSVTIDKQKLLVGEKEDEYFLRVPNTHGVDHIKLKKSEAEEINDGRTLRVRLESKKYYPVFDRNGAFQKERVGNELYRFYDIKHKGINKDTKVVEYGDRINRIDLFNKDKNMLISVGIDNAENIKAELMENGISERAAENLLKDIDELMKEKPQYDEYRSIFNYTAERTEIVYADVPNIGDIIAQTQLSEILIGKAECVGELPKGNGSRLCVSDKASNKFTVVPDKDRNVIVSRLSEMGYDELTAQRIIKRAVNGPDPQDVEEPALRLETNNAELNNIFYRADNDRIVLVREMQDSMKYIGIEKDADVSEIEKTVREGFALQDELSVAEFMKCLAQTGIISLKEQQIEEAVVTKLTDKMIEVRHDPGMDIVNENKDAAIMPMNKLDTEKLYSLGISKDTVSAISNSLVRSERSSGKTGTLGELIRYAKDTIEKIPERVQYGISRGQAR